MEKFCLLEFCRNSLPSMPLIDAHVHLRSGKLARVRPRISAEAALQLLVEDMAAAGVDTSLLITWAEDVPIVAREAAVHPGKLYSLVWFDSRNPEDSLSQLVSLAEQFPSVVIGAKTVFPYLRQHPLQPEFMPLYGFCQDRGLPIQFHFGGSPVMEALCHPNLFAVLARAFPRLTIVCLHTGGGWSRELPLLLRHHPNVYVETEYLQLHEAELNTPPQVVPQFLQNWGLTRVMFGSDRVRREVKYFRRVALVKALPQIVRDDLCYRNARLAYRLNG